MIKRLLLGSALALPLAGPALAQSDPETLRVVPYADLQSLDPIATTIGITQRHATMVYDFLFGRDAEQNVHPQMVEDWSNSEDGLVWRFTLRDGLAFHDGAPVTADDVVASLERWGARDAYGRQIFAVTESLEAEDERTVVWTLTRPYGLMLQALSKTGGPAPVIMPRRIAETDPATPIEEPIGSGPFIFAADEWSPGNVVVYLRNENYVPRDEPASGMAGGKVVHVDRVEWMNIRDPQSAVLALNNGEVDYVENPTTDFLPMLQEAGMEIVRTDPLGTQGMLRMNHLHPPFDDPRARQALLHLMDQERYLQAMFGNPEITQVCHAFFVCGSPLESDAGVPEGIGHDPDRARQLFEEAGYDGEPIIILHPTDVQFMNVATLVLAEDLESIGVDVELQAMDFASMGARRANRAAPEEGGWHLGMSYWPGLLMSDPVSNVPMQASCEQAWAGWPCDGAHQALIDDYPFAETAEDRLAMAEQIQASAYELVPYVPIGQWFAPIAHSPDLSGVIGMPGTLVLWNIDKAE